MSKTARGALLVIAGLILVAAASVIWLLQDREDQLAGQNASILLNELEQELEHPAPAIPSEPAEELEPSEPAAPDTPAPMPETTFSGYTMVGRLSIPSVDIQLPILSTWDYDLLKVAPCRYSGSAEGGDLILLGHNYKSHLKPLAQVAVGAEVEFTAVDGTVYRYTVDAVDTIRGTEVEKLASGHALNIFTCTRDRVHRTVVRCSMADE